MDTTVKKININDISLAKYNPRQISKEEYDNLCKSIDEFGLVDPIIINLKNNKIIGGHQRYKVLLGNYNFHGENEELILLKRGDIGWVFTDEDLNIKSEEHEKALNIALNKISGDWDYDKLNTLIDELLDIDTFDINLTGFDMLDLQELDVDLGETIFDEDDSNGSETVSEGTSKRLTMTIDCRDEDELNILYSRLSEEGYEVRLK